MIVRLNCYQHVSSLTSFCMSASTTYLTVCLCHAFSFCLSQAAEVSAFEASCFVLMYKKGANVKAVIIKIISPHTNSCFKEWLIYSWLF